MLLDEEDQIAIDEAVDPLRVAITQPAARTGIFEGPTGTGAIQGPSPATAAQQEAVMKKWYASLMGDPSGDGTSSSGAVVNTKPDWYEGGPPPQQSAGAGALKHLAQAGAEGAQRQADLSAATPARHFSRKVADQGRANLMGGVAGVLGYLVDRPQQNYAQKLDAAKKEADMHKALGGRNGPAGAQDFSAFMNYQERVARNDELAAETQRRAQLQREWNDPNSEASQLAREGAIQSGIARPEQVAGLSRVAVEKLLSSLRQTQGQDFGADEFDRRATIKQAGELAGRNVDQVIRAQNEKREEERRREQAAVPGVEWQGAPPPVETVAKVRNAKSAHDIIDRSAANLIRIQERLNQKGVLAAAGAGQWRLVEGVMDDETKQLIEEAHQAERAAVDAYRKRAEYGALTGREQEFAEKMVQGAGSLRGFFIGAPAWEALRKDNSEMVRDTLRSYNAHFAGEGPKVATSHDKAPEQQIRKFALPEQRTRSGAPGPVQDPLAGGGTAATAAPAEESGAGQAEYEVTLSSGPTRRRLSSQQALKLTKALGADKVRLVK